jgi:hypothetical protein
MSDSKIKKIVIKKSDLPAFSGENQTYTVRYRIISEDKNRASHWSAQYKLAAPSSTSVQHGLVIDSSKKILTLAWEKPQNLTNEFDVYVSWSGGDWEYAGKVLSTGYSTLVKTGATSVQIAVQVPTFPNKRFTNATLFVTDLTSLVV